jgi:hypothetical protein
MRSTNIKLKDLLKLHLREAEEEKPAKEEPEEDAGEDNPFASSDDTGGGGEEAGDDKEAKPEASKSIIVKFKRPSVKRYNNQDFLDTQGELVALDKNGATLKISDGSTILVNFSDII